MGGISLAIKDSNLNAEGPIYGALETPRPGLATCVCSAVKGYPRCVAGRLTLPCHPTRKMINYAVTPVKTNNILHLKFVLKKTHRNSDRTLIW